MKKFIVLLLLLVLTISSVFASSEAAFRVTMLMDKGIKRNAELIKEDLPFLTIEEKEAIYKSHKESGVLPFFLNLGVGFGIGSFIQGDITNGVIACILDTISTMFVAFGSAPIVTYREQWTYDSNGNRDVTSVPEYSTNPLGIVGTVFMILTRIYEVIPPFIRAGYNNRELRSFLSLDGSVNLALNDSDSLSLSLVPFISYNDTKKSIENKVGFVTKLSL